MKKRLKYYFRKFMFWLSSLKYTYLSQESFCVWLAIVAIIFLCLGYSWRMVQVQSNELKAFEVGRLDGEREFKFQLKRHYKGSTFWYGSDIKVTPTLNGRYILIIRDEK